MNPELDDLVRLLQTALLPEGILAVAACLLFLGATFRPNRHLWGTIAFLALIVAGVATWISAQSGPSQRLLHLMPIVLDDLALYIKYLALGGGAILVLLSWDAVSDRLAAEYHACLLLIVAGLCLTGEANELVTLFMALELISIPTYVLLYLPRYDNAAQEAAMKYFLLSVFSSALLLFGFSYLYGVSGTTNLTGMVEALRSSEAQNLPGMTQVALVMIVAGLGFRITAVPFHFYAPDVYQGTPAVAAAMLAYVPKVAGFAALLRVLGFVMPWSAGSGLLLGVQVPGLFYILAVVTMSLGNVLALLQENVKRLLAYSSVAHAGYMLIGLAIAPDLYRFSERTTGGTDAILFYLVSYGAMTIGAFAILAYLSTSQRPAETVDDLAGLSTTHPGIALLMGLFLFSLIGIPFTAGFWGKFYLFFGALTAQPPEDHPWLFRVLALVGVLNAAIGAWYYLRIVAVMYLRGSVRPLDKGRSWPGLATLWLCAAITVAVGLYPAPLVRLAHAAVALPESSREPERGE